MRHLNPIVAVVALLAAVACSSDSVTDNRQIFGLKLELTPSVDTLFLGGPASAATTTLSATATAQGGRITLPGHVFETGDASIVDVTTVNPTDTSAVVTALALGTTTVAVRVNDTRATATIVVLPYVKSVTVTSAVTQALVGDTIALTAKVFSFAGDVIAGEPVSFSSSSPSATVTADGKVVFSAPGTATITAKSGAATATVSLTALAREFIGGGSNALSSGMDATCGLAPLGRAFCFGKAPVTGIARDTSCFDLLGTVGDPQSCTLVPLPIAGELQLTALAVGDSVACGLTAAGQAYCWGDQTYGQVGNGISKPGTSSLPVRVTGPLTAAAVFTQIAAGSTHACGIIAGGAAFCWGRDTLFQLGGGDNLVANSTTPIPAGPGNSFKAITAGHGHTCGLRTDGVALCWGDNRHGQLGRGAVGGRSDIATAVGGPAFTQISASGDNTCGLTSAGTIYCWGANRSGQTGQAATDSIPTPAPIAGAGYTYVAVGRDHACALTPGGASCWGSNAFGQLGSGLPAGGFSPTPSAVSGTRTFTSLSSGTRTSCAVASDGAYCWGSSMYGATGNQIQALAVTSPQKTAPPQ